jgi:tetratricopeptide (TPR) repeat protein
MTVSSLVPHRLLGALGAVVVAFAPQTAPPEPPESAAAKPEAAPTRAERREDGFERLRAGDAEVAGRAFAALLEEDRSDTAAVEGRVRSLLRQQDWRQALDEARRYAAALPGSARVAGALGEALFRAGRLAEIETVLAGPAEQESAPGRALAVLGRVRSAEGRADEAAAWMDRAVAAAPEDRDVLYWASGSTRTRAEAIERLERYLERSAGDDPDRIEAVRSGVRVLEALGDRTVWVPEARPERATVPLARIWDPTTGTTQGFVLRVHLGEHEKPVPLLLDSGSPGLFVIRRAARKRDFGELAEQSQFGGGGDRKHRTTRGLFPSAAIGDLRFRDALAGSAKQEMDPIGRYHGLIGLSAFEGYRVTLDFAEDRVQLEPPGGEPEGEPYWTVEGQWLVPGTVGGETCLFLLDTGATRTMLGLEAVERVADARLGPPVGVEGFGGHIEGARLVTGVEVAALGLQSGEEPLSAVDLSTRNRLAGIEVAGFLGLDLLDGKRIVVDTVHRRVTVR